MGMERKVAIIDLDSIAYVIGNGNKVLDENGIAKRTEDNSKFLYTDKTEEELKLSTNQIMTSILQTGGFSYYVGFIKGSNTTSYRKTLNQLYKSNRSLESPKWWSYVKQCLIDDWGAIEANDAEVDDYCSITKNLIKDSYIVGIDQDLLFLEGNSYNWKTNKWFTISKDEADYKFWFDMCTGQPADGLKGIEGCGKVGAKNILLESKPIQYKFAVLGAYCYKYGEMIGIDKFYANYRCLKLLDKLDGFIIPNLIEFRNTNSEVDNREKTNTDWL